MTADDIEFSEKDGIAVVRLNRPEKRNAFTIDMIQRWTDYMHEFELSDASVLIMTGTGEAFCSGADRGDLSARKHTLNERRFMSRNIFPLFHALSRSTKALIAAINGPAVAGGLDLALCCDIRIAGRSATFSESYVKLGLVPGDGACWLLPRVVGEAKALELIWTGDFVDAEEAHRIGLINTLVDDDQVFDTAHTLAERIATGPTASRLLAKQAVRVGRQGSFVENLDLVSSYATALRAANRDDEDALAEQ